MKKLLGFILTFHSFLSFASVPAELKSCIPQMTKTIERWGQRGDWNVMLIDGEPPQKAYRSAAASMGRWIELVPETEQGPAAKLITSDSELLIVWKGKECLPQTRIVKRDPSEQQKFFDLLKGKEQGVVYLWAPHMPPAVYGLQEALKASQKLKLPLIAVLHPSSDVAAAKLVLKKLKLSESLARSIRAPELLYLNLTNHAPSMAIFKDQRWVGKVLPGAEGAETYGLYMKQALGP